MLSLVLVSTSYSLYVISLVIQGENPTDMILSKKFNVGLHSDIYRSFFFFFFFTWYDDRDHRALVLNSSPWSLRSDKKTRTDNPSP